MEKKSNKQIIGLVLSIIAIIINPLIPVILEFTTGLIKLGNLFNQYIFIGLMVISIICSIISMILFKGESENRHKNIVYGCSIGNLLFIISSPVIILILVFLMWGLSGQ